mmetsp:Transcript_39328/g.70386  ORF Transcript_39328/g.70386 Transcript_39328/m.70386 type:complete len:213 (+) Transcript_39328:272-910(+)
MAVLITTVDVSTFEQANLQAVCCFTRHKSSIPSHSQQKTSSRWSHRLLHDAAIHSAALCLFHWHCGILPIYQPLQSLQRLCAEILHPKLNQQPSVQCRHLCIKVSLGIILASPRVHHIHVQREGAALFTHILTHGGQAVFLKMHYCSPGFFQLHRNHVFLFVKMVVGALNKFVYHNFQVMSKVPLLGWGVCGDQFSLKGFYIFQVLEQCTTI